MKGYIDLKTCNTVITDDIKEQNFLIEVDENIAFIIAELNRKGYTTRNCCEGHWENDIPDDIQEVLLQDENISYGSASAPYIEFEDGIRLPSIPENWDIDEFDVSLNDNDEEIQGYWQCILDDSILRVDNAVDFYKLKMFSLVNLYNWVKSLPNIKRNDM